MAGDEKESTLLLRAAKGHATVPVGPTKVLGTSNAALVTSNTRKLLSQRWKRLGQDGYCNLLNSLHSNADGDHSNSQSIADRAQDKTALTPLNYYAQDWSFFETDT